jgi:hypothetical protein
LCVKREDEETADYVGVVNFMAPKIEPEKVLKRPCPYYWAVFMWLSDLS